MCQYRIVRGTYWIFRNKIVYGNMILYYSDGQVSPVSIAEHFVTADHVQVKSIRILQKMTAQLSAPVVSR